MLYDWLTEEETRAWLTDSSVHYVGTNSKWTAATLQPFSGIPMKNTVKGNLYSGENFGQYTWSYILFGRRNGQTFNCSLIHEL